MLGKFIIKDNILSCILSIIVRELYLIKGYKILEIFFTYLIDQYLLVEIELSYQMDFVIYDYNMRVYFIFEF